MIKYHARGIATKPTWVEVTLVDGSVIHGKIFVPVQGRISDTLNDERRFVPVELKDGSYLAVAKDSIRHVSLPAAEAKAYQGNDPFLILGVTNKATQEELRKAYHDRCIKNHPDRIKALGLGEEFEELATQNMIRINAAYAQVMKKA